MISMGGVRGGGAATKMGFNFLPAPTSQYLDSMLIIEKMGSFHATPKKLGGEFDLLKNKWGPTKTFALLQNIGLMLLYCLMKVCYNNRFFYKPFTNILFTEMTKNQVNGKNGSNISQCSAF